MEQQILVFGEPLNTIPKDLYIPPEAMRVLLESFEGPLDLLLYLIRKENMNILDIEIFSITEQYLAYIEMMKNSDISLAAEYLLMAATLAEIKARYLLPRPPKRSDSEDCETDPRAELARRLLIYEQMRLQAQSLARLPFVGNGTALSAHSEPAGLIPISKPKTDVNKLLGAMNKLRIRQNLRRAHEVAEENISLAEKIKIIQNSLECAVANQDQNWLGFSNYCPREEGRAGTVVSLMAVLELDKAQVIECKQEEHFAEIFLRARN